MATNHDLISVRYYSDATFEGSSLTSVRSYTGEIRLHGVVSEDHSTNIELTKFPVQGGFEISNHVIKKNRQVTIEGVITDNSLPGQVRYASGRKGSRDGNGYQSTSSTKLIFETLNEIVR